MKLLVFAHKPPPHHGQSYMVQLMLNALGGDQRHARRRAPSASDPEALVWCYHVDARYSREMTDIGRARVGKLFLAIKYSFEALWCRFRYGVRNLYYVPAPGQRTPLYRDWIVMAICRPFFRNLVFHTHAIGLGSWLAQQAQPWERFLSHKLLGQVDLNIVLSDYYREEAKKLHARRIEVVPVGIPDGCPDFDHAVLPRRLSRLRARLKLLKDEKITPEDQIAAGSDPHVFNVLYLSTCLREKGLFDTLDAVANFHKKLRQSSSPIHVHLNVAGKFLFDTERAEFDRRVGEPDLQDGTKPMVTYHGFVGPEKKYPLLRESDCFCFPTYYQVEGQPVSLVEAMAFGLPVVTTRWRAIPELFAPDYPGLVDIKSPEQIAAVFEKLLTEYPAADFRSRFLNRFTEERYIQNLKAALLSVEVEAE